MSSPVEISGYFGGLLADTRTISDYIRKHKKVEDLNNLLYRDKRYSIIRERCNDNAHYNFYKNVLLNDDKIVNPGREKAMRHLSEDISQLMIYHLSYLFYINEHYMMSSDYRDYLDVGETPPKDSQYWVATFIQNIFNDLIKTFRPDIANLIKDKTSMHLE